MQRITSLYPQYQVSRDRRQQNIPVAFERRSGLDRRSQDRIVMDKQLTQDIFEVKSKIAKLETLAPKLFEKNVTTQAPTFSSMANFNQDQYVKELQPDTTEKMREEAKNEEKSTTAFQIGVLSAALAGAIGISFLGSAGAVIAVGTSLYIGARILKILMDKEINEENSKIVDTENKN